MAFLREPKRLEDGSVDLEWWEALPMHERGEFNVWEADLPQKEKSDPQEIVIKQEMLDLSAIEGGESSAIWRPSKFDEYIGQENLKVLLLAFIKGCKNQGRSFPHMLIDGKAGTGKTTIGYLTAKYLDKKMVETVATTLKSAQQLVDLIVESDGGIVFIDEIHMLNEELANFILPVLEDFQINGKRIKPFTLIACTTEKGKLLKSF